MVERTKVLVVEDQEEIRDVLLFSLEAEFNFEVILASNAAEGIKALEVFPELAFVICDFTLPDKHPIEIWNALEKSQKKFHFISTSKEQIKLFPEFFDKQLTAIISKHEIIQGLNNIISKIFYTDPQKKATEPYVRITVKTLGRFEGLHDDLYIRLSTGRYLKFFSIGDEVTNEDILKLESKGIKELHLKKEVGEWLVKELDAQLIEHVKSMELSAFPIKFKVKVPLTENAIKVDSPFSFEQDYVQAVTKKVDEAIKIANKNNDLKKWLKELKVNRRESDYFNTRIGLLCNITCALARAMEWNTDATLQKLVYVCYIHDLCLVMHPELAKCQDLYDFRKIESKLTDKEKELYLNHPKLMSDIVSTQTDAPMEANTIILQHHESADKDSAFPSKMSAQRLAPLSCLFILSVDLADYIIADANWKMNAFIEKSLAAPKYKGAIFQKILRAMESLKLA